MPKVQSTARPSHADAGPIARLRGATVILDERPVLRGVDLEIAPGVTVLRGPNGAGKTTALRALAGLVPLARGERDVPFDLLYLGHRPQLLHGLSARQNLRFFADFRGRTSRAWLSPAVGDFEGSRVAGALERWALLADADRPVERLSAGQRRRASLARLETETCALTLLDEPFAELDAAAAELLRRALLAATALGSAVLVASHGHAELDDLAARVYVLRDGRIELARPEA